MYNKNGVTLIEIITVMAVLGILSAVAFPFLGCVYNNIQSLNLDTASRELLSDMRLAQQKAMADGYVYHMFLDSDNNSYMIYSYKNMDDTVYKKVKLPPGIGFDSMRSTYRDNKISFNERGKPVPFPCTVALKNNSGQYRRITITVGTDYISIRKN